jgi:quinol monooxygenase YgiN
MSERIRVVAVLTPAPGKIEELITSLDVFNALVEANEPGALEYQVYRSTQKETGLEQLVYLET